MFTPARLAALKSAPSFQFRCCPFVLLHLFGEGQCSVGNATKEIWKSGPGTCCDNGDGFGDRKGETDMQGLRGCQKRCG